MADPRSGTGPVIRSVEFYNIELAPLADGRVYVAMLATTVDDEEPQLLTQEIACDTVATIEEAYRQGVAGRPGPYDPARNSRRTTMSRRQSRRLSFLDDSARPADCCGRWIDQDDRPPFFEMLSIEALLMVLPMSFTCSLRMFICD